MQLLRTVKNAHLPGTQHSGLPHQSNEWTTGCTHHAQPLIHEFKKQCSPGFGESLATAWETIIDFEVHYCESLLSHISEVFFFA
jgi:hypothetical protein